MVGIRVLTGIVFLLIQSAAARADAANPLLGTWKAEPHGYVDREGFDFCAVTPRMVFTATTQVMFTKTAQGTTNVIYLVAGNAVYVSSTPGFLNAPKYTILGPNEIQAESMGSCKYTRE